MSYGMQTGNFDYYEPANHGLTLVAEIDTAGSYEFDMVVVWRDGDGKLWAGQDSGCSCPSPFEDHTWPTDFIEVRSMADIEPLIGKATEYGAGDASEILKFKRTVAEAIGGK